MGLVLFDANEHLGKENNEITQLIEKQDQWIYSQLTTTMLAIQLSKWVNYILGSLLIHSYIHECGYLPFQHEVVTDHRGLFLDISNTTLMDVKIQRQAPIQRKIGLTSTMIHKLKYKEYILKNIKLQHNSQGRSIKPATHQIQGQGPL